MAVVKVNVDFACDLAFVEIRDGRKKRFYQFPNLFGTVDLTELGETTAVLDDIEAALTRQAPRCKVVR